MGQGGYLAIAIIIVVALAAITVLTHIGYRRMKVGKGYPDIHPNDEKCGSCQDLGCPFYEKFHKEGE